MQVIINKKKATTEQNFSGLSTKEKNKISAEKCEEVLILKCVLDKSIATFSAKNIFFWSGAIFPRHINVLETRVGYCLTKRIVALTIIDKGDM